MAVWPTRAAQRGNSSYRQLKQKGRAAALGMRRTPLWVVNTLTLSSKTACEVILYRALQTRFPHASSDVICHQPSKAASACRAGEHKQQSHEPAFASEETKGDRQQARAGWWRPFDIKSVAAHGHNPSSRVRGRRITTSGRPGLCKIENSQQAIFSLVQT